MRIYIWVEVGKGKSTSLMGGNNIQSSADHNLWNMLIALGNIALASCYSQIAVDIQVCMHNK